MGSPDSDLLAPRVLILPEMLSNSTTTTARAGTIGISGATVVFFNGSSWNVLEGNNTGD